MEIQKSDKIDQLLIALDAFQDQCPEVIRVEDGTTGGRDYKYIALPELREIIKPVLKSCSLVVIQAPISDGGNVGLYTQVNHVSSGQYWGVGFTAPIVSGGDQGKACQAVGIIVSYFRRYGLEAVLFLASKDTDGVTERPSRTATAPQRRVPAPTDDMGPDEGHEGTHKGWMEMKRRFDFHCKNDPAESLRLFEELGSFPGTKPGTDEEGNPIKISTGTVVPSKWDIPPNWQKTVKDKLERHAAKCRNPLHFTPKEEEVPF